MTAVEQAPPPAWHARSASEVCTALAVDGERGLSAAEATARHERQGPNRLVEAPKDPTWRKLLRILRDPLTIVLVLAALVSAATTHEWETPLVILAVVIFNATLNLIQERRAEHSLKALQDLTVTKARVRRDGRTVLIDADDLVQGDVVSIEAGDVVPADGRLIESATLELQEAALTGESVPTSKRADAHVAPDAGAGDRVSMVFMSTEVTRGRANYVVTSVGMDTQIGRIAGLLNSTERDKTPLQRQIDGLAQLLTWVALVVVALVFALGLLHGRAVTELFLVAVSLAVATIPEGLSAVVAFTLAIGASRLAKHGAIVKNLSAVETLGSTSHICTDKTGTLTLNQMTARQLLCQQRLFHVTGDGYSIEGQIVATPCGSDGRPLPEPVPEPPDVREALVAVALCADATVHRGELVGDPTEGALVVLAEKGDIDVESARAAWPRTAEIPFDSERKYMATFHRWARISEIEPGSLSARWAGGLAPAEPSAVRVLIKGAPDVVLALCTELVTPEAVVALSDHHGNRLTTLIQAIGSQGLRVMAIAQRDIPGAEFEAAGPHGHEHPEHLSSQIRELRLLALVAIEDPPRQEARAAIVAAQGAGITLHMITGDHVGTAAAIADKLGIAGEALSGPDLDAMDDAELASRMPQIGVLARVSPSHKIRAVRALQSGGAVVAMTGDGVNDAPALKQADIGVAMGITGTEVSKGAASMILTDDDFTTIVTAIRQGRGIYGNIVKFVRFQLATAWAFVIIFLLTAIFDVGGQAPFSALQILWVNIIMDGPPALALGVDPTPEAAMQSPPRPRQQRLLTGRLIARIVFVSLVMAGGTLGVLLRGSELTGTRADSLSIGTMAFTTMVFFQVFNLLNVHADENTVFSRYALTNVWIWIASVVIIVLQVLAVHVVFLQRFFTTSALTPAQWTLSIAVGSSVLWLEELRKLATYLRRRRKQT